MRKWALILVFILTAVDFAAAPQRDAQRIKKDKQETVRQIKETSQKIDNNTREVERQLNQLNLVEAEIESLNDTIALITHQSDSISKEINILNDSINKANGQLSLLKEKYAAAVRKMQSRKGDLGTLSFIFSSESFTQAYRRIRYLQQFSQWRARKSEEIKSTQEHLQEQRKVLAAMNEEKTSRLIQFNVSRREFEKKQEESETLIDDLKKEGKTLQKLLKRKEQEAQALDNELERFIVEEQRKAEELRIAEEKRLAEERRKAEELQKKREQEDARRRDSIAKEEERRRLETIETQDSVPKQIEKVDSTPKKTTPAKPHQEKPAEKSKFEQNAEADRKLSGSFESNKGKLLFPVSGRYKIVRKFGVNRHPELKYVKTNNSGIDIEVPSGGKARAIFAGKVSAIFRQPGFNTIVMVRHGCYITIYANLSSISVKKGDELKTGDIIGQIYANPDDGNRSILHFEIRKEKEKLNPELWIK